MSAMVQREQSNKKLYRDIGNFIAQHALDPTPDNYALVHALFADDTSSAAKMIRAATSDGLRLSQKDADRIRQNAGVETEAMVRSGPASGTGQDPEMIAKARKSVDDFTTILESARANAESYHRDLSQAGSQLQQLDTGGNPVIAMVNSVTSAMLDRTRAAEEQLQAAQCEADLLRRRLAEAEVEARSDALTKLPNRRAFEDRAAELLAAGGTVSVAICDIDKFKAINDTHGHHVGDRVLKVVADVLKTSCGGHMVARIGGEEFAVLFDGMAPGEGAAILDRARESLGEKTLKVRETDAQLGVVTFSAGVALCDEGPAIEGPLKRADALLYAAKNAGRNQVMVEEAARQAA